MTLKEVRNAISESIHKDFFENVSINIQYQNLSEPINKIGMSDIYSFFKRQEKLWKNKPNNIGNLLRNSVNHFISCVGIIERVVSNSETWNSDYISQEWSRHYGTISATQINNDIYILTADSPEVDFLISLSENSPTSFNTAYQYLMKKTFDPIRDSNHLRGLILAYEFEQQDHTEILQRRNNEKRSLGKLRSEFETYISEVEKATQEYIANTKTDFDEHSQQIIDLQKNKNESFEQWFKLTQQTFNTFNENSSQKIQDLEKLYIEKLRLEAPVQYWKNRASKMNWMSAISYSILCAVVGFTIVILYSLLTEPLEIFKRTEFTDPGSIKWSLIYITLFSFLAYLVKSVAKVLFSSLHLARDAEERVQLTHVYLALSESKDISKEDKEIILQSIFSRADTGLLKGDSSPTMPGVFIDKFDGR